MNRDTDMRAQARQGRMNALSETTQRYSTEDTDEDAWSLLGAVTCDRMLWSSSHESMGSLRL